MGRFFLRFVSTATILSPFARDMLIVSAIYDKQPTIAKIKFWAEKTQHELNVPTISLALVHTNCRHAESVDSRCSSTRRPST